MGNDDQRLYRTSTTVATMRTYDDTFSGQKIYPGKGKLFVRSDSKVFRFQNGKSESLFLQRKNPRRIAWTVLCRRANRKGITEEQAKSRRRRQARAAQRNAATKEAKEKRNAAQSVKKAEKAKSAAKGAAGQPTGRVVGKQASKGAAPKPKPTTR